MNPLELTAIYPNKDTTKITQIANSYIKNPNWKGIKKKKPVLFRVWMYGQKLPRHSKCSPKTKQKSNNQLNHNLHNLRLKNTKHKNQ